ncbi:hypothetical protein [Halorussus salinus]|uniref:hypothetical protein n=1 Tax=Halorussus salinus TaxID=1364935 RepID=UPI0010930D64|nr:hypothetical protein [Halorussus salinus]
MAETAYLASALVTGVALLAVWAFVVRMEDWRHYDPASAGSGGSAPADATRATDSVAAWAAGFFLLVLVVGGGTVLLVSDAALVAGVGWMGLALAFGALLVGFLLWGTYSSARFRGLQSAQAALLSAWVFGSLFVAAIVAKLVLAG